MLEETNKDLNKIKTILSKFTYYFLKKTRKQFNFERFDFTLLTLFEGIEQDLEKMILDTKKERKNLNACNNDLKLIKELKEIGIETLFINEESKKILKLTFSDIITDFRKDFNDDKKKFIRNIEKKRKSQEFIFKFESIIKNFSRYINPPKKGQRNKIQFKKEKKVYKPRKLKK